uniref:PBC domain-containing protein n=1 Tax=Monopterus albus TaxID=43700 RepID=A0A3Q3ID22_MONAL
MAFEGIQIKVQQSPEPVDISDRELHQECQKQPLDRNLQIGGAVPPNHAPPGVTVAAHVVCLSGFLLHKRKHALNWHRMKSAIFSILCEVKEKTGKMSIQYATPAGDSKLPVGVSVSVCLSLCAGPVIDQWPVYGVTQRLILSLIPGLLTSPCMQACSELTGHVKNLLREQSRMRPISPKQTEQMVTIIHRKFSAVQLQLKQSTCEAVMILRSRFLDYLLSSVFNCCNRFFFISTFMLLYAVNQVEFLVISFLLSSLKVANWFGNKRIRYKKNIGKFQEDA